MRGKIYLIVIALIMLINLPLHSDTSIRAYGLTVSSTPTYGPFGSITQFDLVILQSDGSGYYTYVCKRPNLGPCANVQLNRYVEVNALLINSCSSSFICGEGLIVTLSYVN